jgi:mono/diheme cytochrome c family protein
MKRLHTTLIILTSLAASTLTHANAPTRGDRAQARAAEMPDGQWYEIMDTGPFISDTFLAPGPKGDVAVLKGIAIKVGAEEDRTFVFDTEMLRMVAGFDGRVGLAGTPWNGNHGGNSYLPEAAAAYYFFNQRTPGWAIDGLWTDPRLDGHGPLPRERAKYQGLYRHGADVLLNYTVGKTPVWESPRFENGVMIRHFKLGATHRQLQVLLADSGAVWGDETRQGNQTQRLVGGTDQIQLETLEDGRTVVTIAAGLAGAEFQVLYQRGDAAAVSPSVVDWDSFLAGGPVIYPETITTKGIIGPDERPYALDTIPYPTENPWFANTRFGAFDFFADGDRIACSTWNGDVWIASGLGGDLRNIQWKRYASGLFQTLGLKIVDGVIYTQGRDQITRLHDLNGDGEADYYECFNNDVKITDGFHEFSFDLVTDAEGNFWFSKGMPVLGGGRGFARWTEHNGSILKVSANGDTLERFAWGLRAPGGIGIGPNGEVTTGENEGSWVPRCKITWSEPGSFHGVVPSVWDGKTYVAPQPGAPTDYEKPLVWMPYDVDNSSGSQIWVPEDSTWGPSHRSEMLHFSYGKSSIFRVMRDEVDGQVQGAVYKLPIDLGIPAQRGKFHPQSGALYVMGLRGWQTNGGTGFQRVRYLGEAGPTPVGLKAFANGVVVEFSDTLDVVTVQDVRRFSVKKWNYVWGPQYGSGRFSIDNRDEALEQWAREVPSKGVVNNVDQVAVRAASVLPDGKTVFLYIPNMTKAMQMEIQMDLAGTDGAEVRKTIWNTIHNLRPDFQDHGLDLNNLPEIPSAPIGEPGLTMAMAYAAESDKTTVGRVALTVPIKTTVTPFMKYGRAFETIFEGTLALEQRDELAFRVEGEGEAVLQINGTVVAEGALPIESSAVRMDPGGHDLYVRYSSSGEVTGRVKLLWAGKDFVWEPLPPSALLHTPDSSLDWGQDAREGRVQFAAARCIECHAPEKPLNREMAMPELFERVPDLEKAGDRFEARWLYDWIREPSEGCPQVVFAEAAEVTAYLMSLKSSGATPDESGDAEAGKILVEKLHMQSWVDPMTAEVKLTAAGLKTLLVDPTAHHRDTVFPDFRLSDSEANDIVSFILNERPVVEMAVPQGDPVIGQQIVASNCLVCHGDAKEVVGTQAASLETIWETNWYEDGCASEEWGRRPHIALSADDRKALVKFQNAGINYLSNTTPREYAQRTMERLNCMTCHAGENKLPRIDHAGDKFTTAWLEKLLLGEVGHIHPDQEARMPAFKSRAKILAQSIAALHGSEIETASEAVDSELVKIGAELTGVSGYACVACHAVGDTPALAAFEGQGPNLLLAGERLREDYFHRWMHWPQRVIPTTIMPKYTTSKDEALNGTILEGKPDAQFSAIWNYLQSLRPD